MNFSDGDGMEGYPSSVDYLDDHSEFAEVRRMSDEDYSAHLNGSIHLRGFLVREIC